MITGMHGNPSDPTTPRHAYTAFSWFYYFAILGTGHDRFLTCHVLQAEFDSWLYGYVLCTSKARCMQGYLDLD